MTSTIPDLATLMAEFWPPDLAWLPAPSGEDVLCSATGLVMSSTGYLLLPRGLAGGDAFHDLAGKRVRVSATCGLHGVDMMPDAAWVERARTFVGAYNGRVQDGDEVPVPTTPPVDPPHPMRDIEAQEETLRCLECPFARPIYRTVAVPMPVAVATLPEQKPEAASAQGPGQSLQEELDALRAEIKIKHGKIADFCTKSGLNEPKVYTILNFVRHIEEIRAALGQRQPGLSVEQAEPRAKVKRPEYQKPKAGFTRKCTTCGRPTNNYRCDECWAKRGRGDTDVSPLDPELGDVTYHGTV